MVEADERVEDAVEEEVAVEEVVDTEVVEEYALIAGETLQFPVDTLPVDALPSSFLLYHRM